VSHAINFKTIFSTKFPGNEFPSIPKIFLVAKSEILSDNPSRSFFPVFHSISIQPFILHLFPFDRKTCFSPAHRLVFFKKRLDHFQKSEKGRFKPINFVPSIPEFRESVSMNPLRASRFLLKWWFVFRLNAKRANARIKSADTAYLWLRRILAFSSEKGPQFSGNRIPQRVAVPTRPVRFLYSS
jgi:hypothetical protein